MRSLDPDAVHAFVLVAELRSFTRAARVLNSSQAAVSLKLRRLEDRLGQRLLERTPRAVRLSAAGAAFLDQARLLVEAHRRALAVFERPAARLGIGLSHHIVGAELPGLLARLGGGAVVDLRVGGTRDLLDRYDAGELDAVVVLRHDESRRGGEVLLQEGFAWFAAPGFAAPPGPLPLATQPEPCHLRAMAVGRLQAAGPGGRPCRHGVGSGRRRRPGSALPPWPAGDTEEAGARLGLPPLPMRDLVLHSRIGGAGAEALRRLVEAIRATARPG
ncbi:LysR family transcriptional regulator [Pseudoroseomonas cervicalis]